MSASGDLEVVRRGIWGAYGRNLLVTDIDYWINEGKYQECVARGKEINDPMYAWNRVIGFRAEGADAPKYGPFATPPSDLLKDGTPVPAPVPVPTPDNADLKSIMEMLGKINDRLDTIQVQLVNVASRLDEFSGNDHLGFTAVLTDLATVLTKLDRPYESKVFGATIVTRARGQQA